MSTVSIGPSLAPGRNIDTAEREFVAPTETTSKDRLSILAVLAMTVFVFFELKPSLLFGPNLDVGGDTAAHVASISYFIHHLLNHGQLSGWDPQWFDGFPLYVFYFPLPAVIVAIFNVVFPYNVAFNLVTVLGTLLVPGATYAFGRMAGLKRPTPLVLSIASLVFLFNTSYTIDGGNIASTLAGEFSFSLAVPFGLLFLGYFLKALRTGRGYRLAALFYALTILSHVVPALFFGFTALVLTLMQSERRRSSTVFVASAGLGGLLAGFWLIRFVADLGYSSSMNYVRVSGVLAHLFPHNLELSVQCLALVGALIASQKRNRTMLALVVVAGATVVAFAFLPDGLVYNERWLPFWFLTTTLLAGYAIGELIRAAAERYARPPIVEIAGGTLLSLVIVALLAANLGNLPFFNTPNAWRSFVPDWEAWNYSGYQAKAGWPQFQQIVAMLNRAGLRYGCGRLDYEYTANATNPFGSTLVEMSFPYWTNNCIDSTEGVYYESSTTNDFHFLDQSELSLSSSDPVSGLPYEGTNVVDGVTHLQLMGVKYFLANSAQIEAAANADPSLVKIGSTAATTDAIETATISNPPKISPQWDLYLIKDAPLVAPLHYQPVVEPNEAKATWLKTAIDWYQHPLFWGVEIARSGPSTWKNQPVGVLVADTNAKALPATSVSHVSTTDDSVSFDVSKVGVPILVKIPYFPNWQATGATGPYETSPNLMVVIPTSHHVVLRYGTTTIDWVGRAASILAAIALVVLIFRPLPLRPLTETTKELPLFAPRRRRELGEPSDGEDPIAPEPTS